MPRGIILAGQGQCLRYEKGEGQSLSPYHRAINPIQALRYDPYLTLPGSQTFCLPCSRCC